MPLDIRTKTVREKDGLYTVNYEIFNTAEPASVLWTYAASGINKMEIKSKLTEYIINKKDEIIRQNTLVALSEEIIQDLRDEGIL